MIRFSALLASAALGAALVASGSALARGGGGGGGGHMGGFGGGHFGGFVGRSVAMGGFHRGFGFNRGFDHRFARFDRFRRFNHFNRFRNRFSSFPYFWGGGDFGSADCGFWGDSNCGYGNPDYANSYPDYGYPATGFTGYYAAAPVTGQSEATGQPGSYCTISVKDCEDHQGACSCWAPGGSAPVAH